MVGPSVPPESVRVLVVDADRRVRQGLAGLIRVSDGLLLDGVTGDPATAMRSLETDAPHVVLIDPRLPEAEVGIALVGEITRRWPEVRIVALSAVRDDRTDAPAAPGILFVSPTAPPELLVDALRGRPIAPGEPTDPGRGRSAVTDLPPVDDGPIRGTMTSDRRGHET